MAWLDDRIWAHPKVARLSDRAFRVWVSSICYSSGFGTRGVLEAEHQRLVGCNPRIKDELLAAGMWHARGDGVLINDWDEHNGVRDAKREADRERQKRWRDSQRDRPRDSEA